MAELRDVAIGHDTCLEPGSSMHGVTGREPVLELARTLDFDTHASAPGTGTNTTTFDLPVDSEHKALRMKPFSLRRPHMRAFHLSWLTHLVVFAATFAAAPLLPIIREDLNLTSTQLGTAGIATVTGTIAARIAMGTVCDTVGPRYGISIVVLSTAPAVFCMSLVTSATGFIIARLCIGFALAEFVAIQFWCSSMFSPRIVGLANATAGGWGNLGGGATQFFMPLVFALINNVTKSDFLAWRVAFFVPGVLMCVMGGLVLCCSQDLPDGSYRALIKSGKKMQESGKGVFLVGARNYRTWILVALYGFSFGTELTMNNIAASYFFDRFDVDLRAAGFIASSFGLMNVFSRSTGGVASDRAGRRFGMRGRLWTVWGLLTTAGLLCIVVSRMSNLGAAIATLLIYAIFTQASEGAIFGVVPFISRRALGVVSGFVGAGGNAGSALVQGVFFQNSEKIKTEDGMLYLGFSMVGVGLLCGLIHFPQWGSMFFPPSTKADATEEDYYVSEFTEEERAQNRHTYVLQFAENSRAERGSAYMRRNHKDSSSSSSNNNTTNNNNDRDAATNGYIIAAGESVKEKGDSV